MLDSRCCCLFKTKFIQRRVKEKKKVLLKAKKTQTPNILRTVSLCRYYCYRELYTELNYSNIVNHSGGVKMTVSACFPH